MSDLTPFRVIIAGSRSFNDYPMLQFCCDRILRNVRSQLSIEVISGNARGADRLGIKYAHHRNFKTMIMNADWDAEPRRAGYLRNVEMSKVADTLIAFWDRKSNGTRHMLNIMHKANKPYRMVDLTSGKIHTPS
jgi:hypothetical protein